MAWLPGALFAHEFAGDLESGKPQLRFFGRRYRCIAYNARGYPPWDVPDDPAAYFAADRRRRRIGVLEAAGAAPRCTSRRVF
jgi:hypothetical protein